MAMRTARSVRLSGRQVVDGDAVLLLGEAPARARGLNYRAEPVVATVMSNLGLEKALAAHGIEMARTPVGDKYVLEEMLRRGRRARRRAIRPRHFPATATTGDGLLTALRVFETAVQAGTGLDELTTELQIYPQRLVNVRVASRRPLSELPAVTREIRAAELAVGDAGRVLVCASRVPNRWLE